jgi:hypothetical protein
MVEVGARGHAVAVALGGLVEVCVGLQRGLPMCTAFTVDEAQHGGAYEFEVGVAGRK